MYFFVVRAGRSISNAFTGSIVKKGLDFGRKSHVGAEARYCV
jgi:hypothetical protein